MGADAISRQIVPDLSYTVGQPASVRELLDVWGEKKPDRFGEQKGSVVVVSGE